MTTPDKKAPLTPDELAASAETHESNGKPKKKETDPEVLANRRHYAQVYNASLASDRTWEKKLNEPIRRREKKE